MGEIQQKQKKGSLTDVYFLIPVYPKFISIAELKKKTGLHGCLSLATDAPICEEGNGGNYVAFAYTDSKRRIDWLLEVAKRAGLDKKTAMHRIHFRTKEENEATQKNKVPIPKQKKKTDIHFYSTCREGGKCQECNCFDEHPILGNYCHKMGKLEKVIARKQRNYRTKKRRGK